MLTKVLNFLFNTHEEDDDAELLEVLSICYDLVNSVCRGCECKYVCCCNFTDANSQSKVRCKCATYCVCENALSYDCYDLLRLVVKILKEVLVFPLEKLFAQYMRDATKCDLSKMQVNVDRLASWVSLLRTCRLSAIPRRGDLVTNPNDLPSGVAECHYVPTRDLKHLAVSLMAPVKALYDLYTLDEAGPLVEDKCPILTLPLIDEDVWDCGLQFCDNASVQDLLNAHRSLISRRTKQGKIGEIDVTEKIGTLTHLLSFTGVVNHPMSNMIQSVLRTVSRESDKALLSLIEVSLFAPQALASDGHTKMLPILQRVCHTSSIEWKMFDRIAGHHIWRESHAFDERSDERWVLRPDTGVGDGVDYECEFATSHLHTVDGSVSRLNSHGRSTQARQHHF